jgi:hypothetical protein
VAALSANTTVTLWQNLDDPKLNDVAVNFGCGDKRPVAGQFYFRGAPSPFPTTVPTALPTKAPSPPTPAPTNAGIFNNPLIKFNKVEAPGDFFSNVTVVIGDTASVRFLVSCIASSIFHELTDVTGPVSAPDFVQNFVDNSLTSVTRLPIYLPHVGTKAWFYRNVTLHFVLPFSSTTYHSWCMVENQGYKINGVRYRMHDVTNGTFTFATIHAYPLVTITKLVPATNDITVYVTTDKPGHVYCAATPVLKDTLFKTFNALYNAGNTLTLFGAGTDRYGNLNGTITITGLLALAKYDIYCTSADFSAPPNTMSETSVIVRTKKSTATLCCHDVVVPSLPAQLVAGGSDYSDEVTFELTTAPDAQQLVTYGGAKAADFSAEKGGCFLTLSVKLYMQAAAASECTASVVASGLSQVGYDHSRLRDQTTCCGNMGSRDQAFASLGWVEYSNLLRMSPSASVYQAGITAKYTAFTAKTVGKATYGCWVARFQLGGTAAPYYYEPMPSSLYVYSPVAFPSGPTLVSATFSDSGVFVFITLVGASDEGAAYNYLRFGDSNGPCSDAAIS